ncbi:uncharacterized protein [Leuresthes tenuis]|uniref:uncharacterized protein n=1 Tax=Leuresthes tenuis TaxID=355514 RepID=UPI003B509B01
MIKCADENIIIQLGTKDQEYIVPTHFPCCCIGDGESLTILCNSEKVEQVHEEEKGAKEDDYSVFFIDKVGGDHTKTKKLFRSKLVKKFKYLCVYGAKGMTVEEAVRRDGRFSDNLGDFTLSDNENPNRVTECSQIIDNLHQKAFKICLPLKESEGGDRPTSAITDVAHERGMTIKRAIEQQGGGAGNEEIYERLRQQFPGLKELMENRFPENSYRRALNLRKENFGKIQQSFSEVHRIKKLLKMGKSVCKIIVKDVCQGTGFVLFDHFILTNAHLFEGCVEGKKLQEPVEVSALFDYEDPEPSMNFSYFTAENTLVDIDRELDYAILELKPEGQKPSQTKAENIKVPAGLLKSFGPLPKNGEACIIGHPAGEVKKMDPTCIIEAHNRAKAVDDHLASYKHTLFILHPIIETLKKRGIESIIMGGSKAEKVVTYNTFMYHGASGSPVFDARGQVFGLHTAGFCYECPKRESVIEYAQPLLTIFERFVSNLKESGNEQLLGRVEDEGKKNLHLKKILQAVRTDPEEPMEESEIHLQTSGNMAEGNTSPVVSKSVVIPKNDGTKAQKRVKEEATKDGVSLGKHEHSFKVKFGSENQKYTVNCHQPQTLLQAIKSHLADEFTQKIKAADEKIIIMLDEGANASLLATHFPCSCLEEDKCLIVRSLKRVIEAQNPTSDQVQEKEHYCRFYIEKEPGKDSKSKVKQIFRCTDIREEFRYFCVYGRKTPRMTVEQALKQDGRFVDGLSDFTLCDNDNNDIIKCTAYVSRKMDKRYFRIQLPKEPRFKTKGTKQPASHVKQEQQTTQCASTSSQSQSETISVLEQAQEKGIGVKEAFSQTNTKVNIQEIYDLLRGQFQGLKGWMESRFPGQSFKKALTVSRENFGKIQQSFSEVHTVRELLKLSESVCLLRINDSVQGTGFVLFDNFILTNAHLFERFANQGLRKWWENIKITAEFHFENRVDRQKEKEFAAKVFIDNPSIHPFSTIASSNSGSRQGWSLSQFPSGERQRDARANQQSIAAPVGSHQPDYVLLELIPKTQNEPFNVPPGLLKKFGPVPVDGGACIIGHPAGEVMKMDTTCVIKNNERQQAVDRNLEDYQDYLFTTYSVKQEIKTDQLADVVVTYNTFMYHGSSGSPVFDAHGQVFGLHSGGFFFGFPKPDHSVIEYSFPLLYVFKGFVSSLKKDGRTTLLERVCLEAKGNKYLEQIIEDESSDSEEPMDED